MVYHPEKNFMAQFDRWPQFHMRIICQLFGSKLNE
jgi:hypothetical protein